jgi:hypothetical protein
LADKARQYAVPAALRLNQWALSGDWTMTKGAIALNKPNGRIAYRFHARDVHVVMGPAADGKPIRFRVFVDGKAPRAGHGTDVDDQGAGTVTDARHVPARPAALAHRRSHVRDRVPRSGCGSVRVHVRMTIRAFAAALASVFIRCLRDVARIAERARSSAPEPAADSALVRSVQASMTNPAMTGFRLMPLGFSSLDARVELAHRAAHSLDVQYYLIANDRTGRLFMRNLREAALRGVRVRLLVDDLYTSGGDAMFRGLAAFPNVEVRVFNPVLLRTAEHRRQVHGVARRRSRASITGCTTSSSSPTASRR